MYVHSNAYKIVKITQQGTSFSEIIYNSSSGYDKKRRKMISATTSNGINTARKMTKQIAQQNEKKKLLEQLPCYDPDKTYICNSLHIQKSVEYTS